MSDHLALIYAEALQISREASSLVTRESAVVEQFLSRSEPSRTVLQRSVNGAPRDSEDPTEGATATAFAVSRLARAVAPSPTGHTSPRPLGLSATDWQSIKSTVVADFIRMYGSEEPDNPPQRKGAGDLPNYYSTPLHLAGLASAISWDDVDDRTRGAVQRVSSILVEWLEARPFVSGQDPSHAAHSFEATSLLTLCDGAPNWYLTYLVVDALATLLTSPLAEVVGNREAIVATLDRARASGMLGLSRMLALSISGLGGIFDALDLAGCLATVGRCVEVTNRSDLLTSQLLNRGVELLTAEYLTPYGAFAPKAPALVDRSGALLEVSSSELAELLLSSLSEVLNDDRILGLAPVVRLTCQRATGHRGWGLSSTRGSDSRDLFATTSSVALLSEFTTRVGRIQHRRAFDALNVDPTPDMEGIDYPQGLGARIAKKVIDPVKAGRRDLAAMSLLLYGTPGTAKTTIARKIAADLGWPILELTPSRLLLTGFEAITSRAEDLFSLLSDLRDVVVLFDEFEGFIGRRDSDGASDASKFLTTFMLPKLHRLRDSGQVVFVVATNDPAAIDAAASRPGRIDTVLSVEPPSNEEVRELIVNFSDRIKPTVSLERQWQQLWRDVADRSQDGDLNGMTYGYISRWIKDVALDFHEEYNFEETMKELSRLRERLHQERSTGGSGADK